MRADGMWKNSFYLGFARRPLPGALSTHRDPVSDSMALQRLSAAPLDLDGPRDLPVDLHDYLRLFYHMFMSEPTLYIIPHAVAGQQRYEVTGQTAPDKVQKYRESLASVAAGGQAGRYRHLAHGKALTASHIE